MNEKYDDDDDYYAEDEPYEEPKVNINKTDKKDFNDSDDDNEDDTSKRSNGSENDDDELSGDDVYDDGSEDDDDTRNKRLFAKEKNNETQNNTNIYPGSEYDEDEDDDEDDYDENYLQKFDEKLKQNIISEYHPEMQQLNYSEVELLTVIHRDVDGQIYDPLHRTLPFLTKFEKARVLGERAKQINDGAKPFVKLTTNAIDGYLIALTELEQKAIPFIIKRPLPNGGCEYWKLKDLEVLM